ncbi:protein pigeon isoform X2 [Octopus sinensis]|uniref:Protein pigeon isoform X2 n=1 Tax=Octopus sinensis TaxID=2607531 RepID=A0A7E6FM86_9MOLL|nr:protein pigeon isoform X2 [Octopus sinensis]
MLELKPVVDIGLNIKNFIQSRSENCETLRLINQEKDGSILFSWEEKPAREDHLKTHIGLACPDSKDYRVVWVFDKVEYVTSCSINQHHTLLAFTILTEMVDEFAGQKIYTAFLAEILTPNRLFSLNIERVNFLKVQFLHLTNKTGQESEFSDRQAYMLVFLHKESIGLYHIPLARAEDAMIMKRQPEKEQLIGEFLWSSWDVHNQRLHYIYHQHDDSVGYRKFHTILSTLQFSNNGKYDSMIDVPLNFPIPFMSKTGRPVYIDIPLCSVIPDRSINLEVITMPNGTFCICYQPTLSQNQPQAVTPEEKEHNITDEDLVDVTYFVCLVHHAHTLQGSVSKIPKHDATRRRILFTWFNGYLVVSLPGFFTHLLNVSIEYEPCNHILLHRESLYGSVSKEKKPSQPEDRNTKCSKTNVNLDDSQHNYVSLLHASSRRLQLRNHYCKGMYLSGWLVYDKKSQRLYKLLVNKDQLLHLFSCCYLSTTRMALFHYILLHLRDYNVIKDIFVALSNDCASPEVQELLSEFLVSTTYLKMRQRVSKSILTVVPFTTADSFRGQLDKNQSNEILSKIQYHVFSNISISRKSVKDRVGFPRSADLWDTLRQHLRQNQIFQLQFPRFSTSKLPHQNQSTLIDIQKLNEVEVTDGNIFLTKLISNQSVREPSSSESEVDSTRTHHPYSVLGALPHFLETTKLTKQYGILMLLTKEAFTEFLIKFRKTEPQVKLENIAKEYVASQLCQARQLCQFAWSVNKPHEKRALYQSPTKEEYGLFQLFERISMALKEQTFPITDGFCTYFTTLAFRCLSLSQFLHYVDSGAVLLTDRFVKQVISDLKDDDVYSSLKYQIITRLSEKSALQFCQDWKHPYSTTFFTMNSIPEILLNDWVLTGDDPASAFDNESMFYPLAAFTQYLNEKNEPNNADAMNHLGNRRLQDVALCHTRTETDCNLGNVNF